jgi:hypothetical protein
MPKIAGPWNHYDWDSREYVSDWAKRQDKRETDRAGAISLNCENLAL